MLVPLTLVSATLTLAGVRAEQVPIPDPARIDVPFDAHDAYWAIGQPRASAAQATSKGRDAWTGLVSFANTPPYRCWGAEEDKVFDIAVIGAPFDTGTTGRPGTRFGPNGIRQASRRLGVDWVNVPYKTRVSELADVVDCGDVPMVPVDSRVALRQLENGAKVLLNRTVSRENTEGKSIAKDGKFHPRVLTLGGDHTITLPLLRGVHEIYGPVSVVHFDSHIDTWKPGVIAGGPWLPDEEIPVHHGSYFWYAAQEGLLAPNSSNIHVGIRNDIMSWDDYKNDLEVGFVISHADDVEQVGWRGIVKHIREVVGDNPVYITFDIDVVDPAQAPATGTPETGGFSTREIKHILRGLDGLKIVGADIVEVSPPYDSQDEITSLAASKIAFDILTLMARTPLTA